MKCKKEVNLNFPIFIAAALTPLILKLTAYPTISWWIILAVGFFPFLFVFSIIAIVAIVFAPIIIIMFISEFIDRLKVKNKK